MAQTWRRSVALAACGLMLLGCGVTVHAGSDRAIGGGPEQATAQARTKIQATIVAAATATGGFAGANAQPCDCESSGK
jgi:hypothetical protein